MSNDSTDLMKVVLITGTSRGIGNHLAKHYLSSGLKVIGCSRSESSIEHDHYRHFCIDVADEKQILEMFTAIRKEYGRLDVLINNAAINPTLSPALLIPLKTIIHNFHVNVFSVMLFCREAVKLMARNKFGRVINMGSMASKLKVKGESIYSTTKSAVNTYSEILAKEVNHNNITVNVVAPSAIETDLSAQIDEQALKDVLARNAIPHYGVMADITNVTDWLIRPESNAVTGQIIYLGGV
jgi:3-oxoacyl-[acyl-carrier protein] reductase